MCKLLILFGGHIASWCDVYSYTNAICGHVIQMLGVSISSITPNTHYISGAAEDVGRGGGHAAEGNGIEVCSVE